MGQSKVTNLSYEAINDLLVEHLPAVRGQYDELRKWWGEEKPGPHVVYGDILNPYIEQTVRDGDAASLARIFEFVEILSESSDARVRDVVSATICDFLVSNELVFKRATLAMKPSTRLLCQEVVKARLT